MTKNTILSIVVVLFILIAVGVGYTIKKEKGATQGSPTTKQEDSAQKILAFRPQDASEEERAQFRELVKNLAQEGNTINIHADCTPDPLVLKSKLEGRVTVNNVDSIEHRLSRAARNIEIIISPNDSATFQVSDFVGPDLDPRGGVVRYGCDTVVSGILYITP